MPTDIPPLPAPVLRLRDLAGWKLVIACACDRSAIWPVELLVRRHGPDAEPAVIVRRMRCVWCGLRPAFAEIVADSQEAQAARQRAERAEAAARVAAETAQREDEEAQAAEAATPRRTGLLARLFGRGRT